MLERKPQERLRRKYPKLIAIINLKYFFVLKNVVGGK